jgi:hypothetical protein
MSVPNDILRDKTGDVACSEGDFVIGDATLWHQHDLLFASKGEYKESAMTGVDIESHVNNNENFSLIREINRQFANDGMEVNSIRIESSGIQINAKYK